jgi:hypothetical protein
MSMAGRAAAISLSAAVLASTSSAASLLLSCSRSYGLCLTSFRVVSAHGADGGHGCDWKSGRVVRLDPFSGMVS